MYGNIFIQRSALQSNNFGIFCSVCDLFDQTVQKHSTEVFEQSLSHNTFFAFGSHDLRNGGLVCDTQLQLLSITSLIFYIEKKYSRNAHEINHCFICRLLILPDLLLLHPR